MTDRFDVGEVIGGAIAGRPPIADRRLGVGETAFGVVMGDQLGRGILEVGKLIFLGLCNRLVDLLAAALEQALIRRILD